MDIYFTIQRSQTIYFSHGYGVVETSKPLANGEKFDMEPLLVTELRFPDERFSSYEYSSSTQFFRRSEQVDLVAWIESTIMQAGSKSLVDSRLIVDPKTYAALTESFHSSAKAVGLRYEEGDRSNKRHVAHFNQCQKSKFYTAIERKEVTQFPHEPLGLSLFQLNKCSVSLFHSMINPAKNQQIDVNHCLINEVPIRAIKVSGIDEIGWRPAEELNGIVHSGMLLLEQDNPLHKRNGVYQDPETLPLDQITMRHLLSLIPNKAVFADQLSIATGRSFPVTAHKELNDFVNGRAKSLFNDIQYALNDLFNLEACDSAVFHLEGATKLVIEDVVDTVTCSWDHDKTIFLFKCESDKDPLAAVFIRETNFWAFVAPEARGSGPALVDLLGDSSYAAGRPIRLIAPIACSSLQELTFGIMPSRISGSLYDFFDIR